MTLRRSIAGAALAIGLLAIPQAALAATDTAANAAQTEPITITDARPYWRIVPPTTDPEPVSSDDIAVAGVMYVRGTVLHGEGDLLLLDIDGLGTTESLMVVRIPLEAYPAEIVPVGAIVEATGPGTPLGIFSPLQLRLWPAP